jgi:hypothetical protein
MYSAGVSARYTLDIPPRSTTSAYGRNFGFRVLSIGFRVEGHLLWFRVRLLGFRVT